MPKGPAARVADPVMHPLPPVLTPGTPGSLNVLIGGKPAWRGVGGAVAAAVSAAKSASNTRIKVAEAATLAAPTPESKAAAKAAEMTLKGLEQAAMSTMILGSVGSADIHVCATPLPPHGPGIVVDGSKTVLINGMPACRMGDTIVEAFGPPNKIMMGLPTVIIGG